MAGLDGVRLDVVAVNCIENNNQGIATAGGDGETASLVAVKFAFNLGDSHVDMMAAVVLRGLGDRLQGVGLSLVGDRPSRLSVGSTLVHGTHLGFT